MNGLPKEIDALLPADHPLVELTPDERLVGILLLRMLKDPRIPITSLEQELFRNRGTILFKWNQKGVYIGKK